MSRILSHPPIELLRGQSVQLTPFEDAHIEGLMRVSRANPEVFRYTSTPITDAQRDAYFGRVKREIAEEGTYTYTMMTTNPNAQHPIIGTTRLTDIKWQHMNCELGFTWIDPAYQGTTVNVESKLLLLEFAFETLEMIRVQIHTDARNVRSQAAIRALGATYEGTLRYHQIAKDGHLRDTVVFSIIQPDWPGVKTHLQQRLAAKAKQR